MVFILAKKKPVKTANKPLMNVCTMHLKLKGLPILPFRMQAEKKKINPAGQIQCTGNFQALEKSGTGNFKGIQPRKSQS